MLKKFEYIVSTFKTYYNSSFIPEIGYGTVAPLIIKKSVVDGIFNQSVSIDYQRIIWKNWKGQKIPFIFDYDDDEIFTETNGTVTINFDIIASAFYLLSGFQELDRTKTDSLDRFLFSESIQYKLGITQIPVVNYYFDILKTGIEMLTGSVVELGLTNDRAFTACLTHDIDNCENAWLEGSFWAIKKGHLLTPFKLLYSKFILGKDKWFNFHSILELERSFHANSSFYFLCKKGKYLKKNNADYDIINHKFRVVFEEIRYYGSEIGIHGSFGTHTSASLLSGDLVRLKQPVFGGRFHFLEFDIGKSPSVLEAVGLKYDSSLCFAEHVGFRNSFCYPFLLYDFASDRSSTVWEIPLVLMDSTLQSKNYMNISPEKSPEVIDKLVDEIKKFRGVFTILWHNTMFSNYKYQGWQEVYFYFLKKCQEENALLTNGNSILDLILKPLK